MRPLMLLPEHAPWEARESRFFKKAPRALGAEGFVVTWRKNQPWLPPSSLGRQRARRIRLPRIVLLRLQR